MRYVSLVQLGHRIRYFTTSSTSGANRRKVRNVFTCVVQVDDLREMQFGQILDPFGAIA